MEGLIPGSATVTIEGDWSADPITLTQAGDVYEATISTQETPLTYRYVVDGDATLLNPSDRTVTPIIATTYDDYLLGE